MGPAISTIRPRTPTTRPYILTPSMSVICSASAFIAKTLSFHALGPFLNLVFTRIVNHYVTVFGVTERARPSIWGASHESRLDPTLNVEPERGWKRKAASTQHLRAIR